MNPIDFSASLKMECNIPFIFNKIGESSKFESVIDLIKNPALNKTPALNSEDQSASKFLQYFFNSYTTNPGVFLQGFHNLPLNPSSSSLIDLAQTELGNSRISAKFFEDMKFFGEN